jgi:hypothetical protein
MGKIMTCLVAASSLALVVLVTSASGEPLIVVMSVAALAAGFGAYLILVKYMTSPGHPEHSARICLLVLVYVFSSLTGAAVPSFRDCCRSYAWRSSNVHMDVEPVKVWRHGDGTFAEDGEGELYIWAPELGWLAARDRPWRNRDETAPPR